LIGETNFGISARQTCYAAIASGRITCGEVLAEGKMAVHNAHSQPAAGLDGEPVEQWNVDGRA
jgi:hypothetical protein